MCAGGRCLAKRPHASLVNLFRIIIIVFADIISTSCHVHILGKVCELVPICLGVGSMGMSLPG